MPRDYKKRVKGIGELSAALGVGMVELLQPLVRQWAREVFSEMLMELADRNAPKASTTQEVGNGKRSEG